MRQRSIMFGSFCVKLETICPNPDLDPYDRSLFGLRDPFRVIVVLLHKVFWGNVWVTDNYFDKVGSGSDQVWPGPKVSGSTCFGSLPTTLIRRGGCFLLRAGDFCYSLDVLHWGLGINMFRVPDPDWIRIQSGQWIRIRIQEGKNYPQK